MGLVRRTHVSSDAAPDTWATMGRALPHNLPTEESWLYNRGVGSTYHPPAPNSLSYHLHDWPARG